MRILLYPDSRLTNDNIALQSFGNIEIASVTEMFRLMYESNGIGLAAPQVGWNVKLFIMNVTGKKDDERIYFNPSLTLSADKSGGVEGCLSFPGVSATIVRSDWVTITADTPNGQVNESFDGLWSRVIQHEFDHIEQTLMIEKMNQADERRNNRVLRQLRRNRAY